MSIFEFGFQPGTITVGVGDTVVWRNDGDITHTTSSGTWDSGNLASAGTFSQTFSTPGTFNYQCNIHPGLMTGTVVVNP